MLNYYHGQWSFLLFVKIPWIASVNSRICLTYLLESCINKCTLKLLFPHLLESYSKLTRYSCILLGHIQYLLGDDTMLSIKSVCKSVSTRHSLRALSGIQSRNLSTAAMEAISNNPNNSKGTKSSLRGLTGGEIFHEMMLRHDVKVVFGYPGGAILPVYDAIYNSDYFDFVLPRHEQGAGHMAEGYARVTGKPGVVLVTSGPGMSSLM